MTNDTFGKLSGNALKIIAAIAMFFDHFGMIFFPEVLYFRYVGRLAFPLFAFFIAEGCKYTRNRPRYLLTIYLLAVLFQTAYFVVLKDLYMSVFVTFTLGITLVYLFDNAKRALKSERAKDWQTLLAIFAFLFALYTVYRLNEVLTIDYTFWGCVLPLFSSLFHTPPRENTLLKTDWDKPSLGERLDCLPLSLISTSIPLFFLSFTAKIPGQYHSFLALLLLCLYSGKRGKRKMKYFFYFFYPVHLVLLYGVYFLTAIC